MAEIGAVRAPRPIPSPNLPRSGQRPTTALFYLRATPRIFTVLNVGGSNTNQDFAFKAAQIPSYTARIPFEVYAPRFTTGAGKPDPHKGRVDFPITFGISTAGGLTNNEAALGLTFGISTRGAQPAADDFPSLLYDVSFFSNLIAVDPTWSDLSSRVRGLSTRRGRSYEFDRTETGTAAGILSNRDAALSPINTASPFYPLLSTRPTRAQLVWDGTTYPLFRGISEGYPQAYPSMGKDAVVEQHAADLFYALNRARFTPGSTALGTTVSNPPQLELQIVPAGTEEVIEVGSTDLPMPQSVPFEITIDEGTVASETLTVTEIVSLTQYRVTRGEEPQEHYEGAIITTQNVSFAEELSGVRIQRVLERVGFIPEWLDIDAGQSVVTTSGDLAGTNPLEHINLIAEAEFGRFFVSAAGLFTFRDRHSIILDFAAPVVTFADETLVVGSEIPYVIDGAIEHSEEKLYNRVKITIPSGEVIDVSDATSIAEHFERTFERSWPYANINDADSAARFILARQAAHTLRLPQITVHPTGDPAGLWPQVLPREIGDRCRFRYQPEGGGDELDQEVIIEGISHNISPRRHTVSFQLTEADSNQYWILGTAGFSELGETTWAGF